jgi:hypothetical protein
MFVIPKEDYTMSSNAEDIIRQEYNDTPIATRIYLIGGVAIALILATAYLVLSH